jgi:hypothetical protein
MGRKTDDEDEKVHFKTDRFFLQNGEWFYLTRDGEERGPFQDKQDANGDLILYLRAMRNDIFE